MILTKVTNNDKISQLILIKHTFNNIIQHTILKYYIIKNNMNYIYNKTTHIPHKFQKLHKIPNYSSIISVLLPYVLNQSIPK